MPLSAFDWTGTPSTGRCVFAAVMPGKCAAPPADVVEGGGDHCGCRRSLAHHVRADPVGGDQLRRPLNAHPEMKTVAQSDRLPYPRTGYGQKLPSILMTNSSRAVRTTYYKQSD